MIRLELSNGTEIYLNLEKIVYTFSQTIQLGLSKSYRVFLGVEVLELKNQEEFDKLNTALKTLLGE
jgi:hypothetical protein